MRVKTNEIAEIWARGTDKSLRCTSSCEVNGNIFISYSTPIARRLEHNGKIAFVVDTRFFSMSTRKHQALVSRATSNELDASVVAAVESFFADCDEESEA